MSTISSLMLTFNSLGPRAVPINAKLKNNTKTYKGPNFRDQNHNHCYAGKCKDKQLTQCMDSGGPYLPDCIFQTK